MSNILRSCKYVTRGGERRGEGRGGEEREEKGKGKGRGGEEQERRGDGRR